MIEIMLLRSLYGTGRLVPELPAAELNVTKLS
jgi:hypothetical protein